MADQPPDSGMLAQVGVGVTAVLGWLFALFRTNKKDIDNVSQKLDEHRLHVAQTYPTTNAMNDAFAKMLAQINESLGNINRRLDKIETQIERLRDER